MLTTGNVPLPAKLKLILPLACLWVKRQEFLILRAGVPLSSALIVAARNIGIEFPERVRLQKVTEVPPLHPFVRLGARKMGFYSNSTCGMSLRYGIFIRSDNWNTRSLVIHELAHTHQYERLGGVRPFLRQYLYECLVSPGYPFGPLEQEAKKIEEEICGS
jgi:hypothetical protein